jgi:tRNA dimethylallyltransferase
VYAYSIMENKSTKFPFMLIIYGPTGVGKTDIALTIAANIPAEIINMDVGQFYTPLSIGTAKPDWKNSAIPHHLFDIINTPLNYTVSEYRKLLYTTVHDVIKRHKLPILVGGTGFYLHSLLFSPEVAIPHNDITPLYDAEADLWQELYDVDPVRALRIDKADMYRIKRALSIWHATGKLPSSYVPIYHPEADYSIIFLERDRKQLYQRINARVLEMFDQGWIAEAQTLIGTPWQKFIQHKNIIGYNEIFDYLSGKKTNDDFCDMINKISNQTRHYAKRQFTFWRKLEREIKKEKQYTGNNIGCLEAVNLTNIDIDTYINELLKRLPLFNKK